MELPDWIPSNSGVVMESPMTGSWSREKLLAQVRALAVHLREQNPEAEVFGLCADNSPHWVVADLATHCVGKTLVPLPGFFNLSQSDHIVATSSIDVLFCDDPKRAAALGFNIEVASVEGLRKFERARKRQRDKIVPPASEIQKITFTSGTSGTPKGVCLSVSQQLDAARALAAATGSLGIKRHLSLLPLPVLLENVAGVYAALLIGANCILPSLADVGLTDGSRFDVERCLTAIEQFSPHSLILLPQMLQALVTYLGVRGVGDSRMRSLKFVAVGGARTPLSLLQRARELQIPVYEGYGLSECASVVTLNVPGANKPGTVGRPLQGIEVRVASDGELEVLGRGFCGILGTPSNARQSWFKTGDLGTSDSEGYISITGRKTNILITSFGRNISPEWPESFLLESPLLLQAVVFGEARPNLVAVLVAAPQVDDDALARAVSEANQRLPVYAHIQAWTRTTEPFTHNNGLATANGRIRRHAVWSRYAARLNELYDTESHLQ